MSKRFTVGDIHGCYLGLKQVLERSNFDYENDELITIGDIVDGGSDTFLVVEELLKISNRIDIRGNHDDWFLTFIDTSVHPDKWCQGGLNTAKSYAKGLGIDLKIHMEHKNDYFENRKSYMVNLISDDIPETHKAFFRRQTKYYKDNYNNIFVHGGFNRANPLEHTLAYIAMWDRKLWEQALSANATKTKLKFSEDVNQVFIGHTSTVFQGTDKPMKADKVWNIDTGGGGGGKVTLMNIDTNEYFQSDLVDELYPDRKYN